MNTTNPPAGPWQQPAPQQYQQANHQQYAQPQQQFGPPAQQQHAPRQYAGQQQAYDQQGYAGGQLVEAAFVKHTGMLLAWSSRTERHYGTFEQISQAYKSAQVHNLAAGWWSVASILFWNWFALIRNAVVFGKVKKAAGR